MILPTIGSQFSSSKNTPKNFVFATDQNLIAKEGDHIFRRITPLNNPPILLRSDHPFPEFTDFGYFEVTLLQASEKLRLTIGVTDEINNPNLAIGESMNNSYSYCLIGKKFHRSKRGSKYGEKCEVGDTVGCGIDFQRRTIFFTRNGKHLGKAFGYVSGIFYPALTLFRPRESVKINMSPPFQFDFKKYLNSCENEFIGPTSLEVIKGLNTIQVNSNLVVNYKQIQQFENKKVKSNNYDNRDSTRNNKEETNKEDDNLPKICIIRSDNSFCTNKRFAYYEIKIRSERLENCLLGVCNLQFHPVDIEALSSVENVYYLEIDTAKRKLRRNEKNELNDFRFSSGDTIGCGVDYHKKYVFFTKNGKKLSKKITSTEKILYPIILLSDPASSVQFKLQEPFQFDLKNYILKKRFRPTEFVLQKKQTNFLMINNQLITGKKESRFTKEAVFVIKANNPFNRNTRIGYFEIQLFDLDQSTNIAVGLTTPNFAKNGTCKPEDIIDNGYFYFLHRRKINLTRFNFSEIKDFNSPIVIGCCVDFLNHIIFFTKNGKSLGYVFSDVNSILIPSIAVDSSKFSVRYNLNGPFKFDLQNLVQNTRHLLFDNTIETRKDPEWRLIVDPNNGKQPKPRYNCASFSYREKFYIHGGFDYQYEKNDGYYSDFWCFNTITETWELIANETSLARLGHSIVIYNDIFYSFGGSYGNIITTNDIWYWDQEQNDWVLVDLPKNMIKPKPRIDPVIVGYQKKMWILLGFMYPEQNSQNEKAMGDVWSFDFETCIWEEHTINGEISKRGDSASCFDEKNGLLYIFGGLSSYTKYKNDLWVFDINNLTINKSQIFSNKIPMYSSDNSMIQYQEKLYLFAGRSKGYLNQLKEIDVNSCLARIIPTKEKPKERIGYGSAFINQKWYIFGGSYSESNYHRLNLEDTWVLQFPIDAYTNDFLNLLNKKELADIQILSSDNKLISIHSSMIIARIKNISISKFILCCKKHNSYILKILLKFIYSGLYIVTNSHKIQKKLLNLSEDLQFSKFTKIIKLNITDDKKGFQQDMLEFQNDQVSKNYTITVKNFDFKMHKIILQARSQLFRGMFLSIKDQTNKINDYSGLSIDAMKMFLQFLYTGTLSPNIPIHILNELYDTDEFHQITNNHLQLEIQKYLQKIHFKEKEFFYNNSKKKSNLRKSKQNNEYDCCIF
ncbi:ran-binding protein m [Anaeramoeba flamelloides]|uniref:Ran-binding protein m n=1 Tax=Anaeramoeba flamelloides TaxID=1746091 RepID=A0AAV8AJL5_9EUKA|nr:ran-binding protein m [Anaeramoeba flamelloides]